MSVPFRDLERDPKIIAGQAFAQVFAAYLECSDEVQAVVRDLVLAIKDPATDPDDRRMALVSIAEALFPPATGPDGHYGVDLESAEEHESAEGQAVLAAMDAQEATFAVRVHTILSERGWTQSQLAEAIGIGQPAVSLLLSRECRPQRRTVEKIAKALQVDPAALWPDLAIGH